MAKGIAMAQLNDNKCELIDTNTMRIHKRPDRLKLQALTELRHRWTVLLLVFCTESNGKLKMVSDYHAFGSYNTQAEITDLITEHHIELARECEAVMTVNAVGFFAIPAYKYPLDDLEAIDELFNKGLDGST